MGIFILPGQGPYSLLAGKQLGAFGGSSTKTLKLRSDLLNPLQRCPDYWSEVALQWGSERPPEYEKGRLWSIVKSNRPECRDDSDWLEQGFALLQ